MALLLKLKGIYNSYQKVQANTTLQVYNEQWNLGNLYSGQVIVGISQ